MAIMQNIKRVTPLKDLVLLFAVPIAITLVAAAVIYIPRLLANPSYDFVYSVCNSYQCDDKYYADSSGTISMRTSEETNSYNYRKEVATLRYYDVETDSSRSVTLNEAQEFELDVSSKSPDGYTLSKQGTGGSFLSDGYKEEWMLEDGLKKKKTQLGTGDSLYSQTITLLGWVK